VALAKVHYMRKLIRLRRVLSRNNITVMGPDVLLPLTELLTLYGPCRRLFDLGHFDMLVPKYDCLLDPDD
jgi:hypothetical protein